MTLPKWSSAGPGLGEGEGRGGVYAPAVPACHEHCDACFSTGCPVAAHAPDWTLGYREVDGGEAGGFWLCPLCFDWYREALGLRLDPDAAFPVAPCARASA